MMLAAGAITPRATGTLGCQGCVVQWQRQRPSRRLCQFRHLRLRVRLRLRRLRVRLRLRDLRLRQVLPLLQCPWLRR